METDKEDERWDLVDSDGPLQPEAPCLPGASLAANRRREAAFRTLFCEAGFPEEIRTDNRAPFASYAIQGLCPLNVWWIQLGIVHPRIRPASPQENGQHERTGEISGAKV